LICSGLDDGHGNFSIFGSTVTLEQTVRLTPAEKSKNGFFLFMIYIIYRIYLAE
jgi:hypothetical protein